MVVDGRKLAEDLLVSLETRRRAIARPVTLGVLVCGGNAATESFVRIKAKTAERLNITLRRVDVSVTATTDELIFALRALAEEVDAIVVQLPLPQHIAVEEVIAAIPKEKDADALNPNMPFSEQLVHAPVAGAVNEILRASHVSMRGARATVVGAGRLVGKPVADMLRDWKAEVSVVTLAEGNFGALKNAQIVVSGAGSPGLIKPEMLSAGVALIDAGTSGQSGMVVGDADPACAKVAGVFTPVPGGVGPVTIAKLFENVLSLAEHEAGR